MCKMLLPFDNENMDGRRKIPYIWDNIPTHIKDLNVKWIIELYEQFSLANKNKKIENCTRLKGTPRMHVFFNFDWVV